MSSLNSRQQEVIIDWMEDQSDAFTVEDVQIHFNCHYMTAYKWMKDLEKTGFVEKHPLRRGRQDQYIRVGGVATNPAIISQQALKVQHGNVTMSVAEWAMSNLSNSQVPSVAYALVYLYVRSYYAEAPDHQHLRGATDPVRVRSLIADRLRDMKKDVEVVEQILSYRQPFVEGSGFSQRFGDPPVGYGMSDAIAAAELFSTQLNAHLAAVRGEPVQDMYEPPVKAEPDLSGDVEIPVSFEELPSQSPNLMQQLDALGDKDGA